MAEVEEVAALLLRWEIAAAHLIRAAADRAVLSVPEFLALSEIAARPVGLVVDRAYRRTRHVRRLDRKR